MPNPTERKLTGGPADPVYLVGVAVGAIPEVGISSIPDITVVPPTIPVGSPVTGQAIIVSTGVAQRLAAASIPLIRKTILLYADSANSAVIGAGGTDVSNIANGTGTSLILPTTGVERTLFANDVCDIWIMGTKDDWISYTAV